MSRDENYHSARVSLVETVPLTILRRYADKHCPYLQFFFFFCKKNVFFLCNLMGMVEFYRDGTLENLKESKT